jgi:hypothetical protein
MKKFSISSLLGAIELFSDEACYIPIFRVGNRIRSIGVSSGSSGVRSGSLIVLTLPRISLSPSAPPQLRPQTHPVDLNKKGGGA